MGIIEFCPRDVSDVFDHDNKGFKAVQNVLKGGLFPDDDCFELSLGLFTTCCVCADGARICLLIRSI